MTRAAGSEERDVQPWWSWRWLPFWAAFAAALALRLVHLGLRPLHHDEGVNAWFLLDLLRGDRYAYNPESFHGPFLYFFGWLPLRLLGQSEVALRLPVALASALMVPMLLPLRRRLGVAGVTGTAWLLALSPSLVYYGRDLIHETYLVAFTLALVVSVSLYLETRRDSHLALAAACLGLLLTVKETAVLTLAGLLAAAALARPPLALPSRRALSRAALCLAAPYVLLFTSFFTHPRGLADSFLGLLPWAQKGIEGTGHEKPWDYFLRLLLGFEPAVLVGAALGGWIAVRRRDRFGVFCAAWTAAMLALYSAIPYKTPWLALSIVLPAALTAGVLFREAASRPTPGWARGGLTAVCVLALGWSAWRAADASLRRYDDPRLDLAYVQTQREALDLVAFVRGVAERSPQGKGLKLKAFMPHRWPLPWYFRDFAHAGYWREVPPGPDGDVLIFAADQEAELRPLLRERYSRHPFPFRPGVSVVVYVNERIREGSSPL